jgi:hypothetical protein
MSLTKRKLTCLIFENSQKKPKRIFYKKMKPSNKKINDIKSIGTLLNKSEQKLIQDKTKNNIINLEDANNKNINRFNKDNFNKENDVENNQNETIYRLKKNDINNNLCLKSNILSNKIINSLSDENINKDFNIRQMSLTNSRNKSKSIYEFLEIKDFLKRNKSSSNRKNQKYLFPYYYFFFDFFYDKVISPKKFFCIPKTYFTIYNFMCQIYDISTHIILFKNFNLIKNALKKKLAEDNIFCPSLLYNKINISDNKLIKRLNRDFKT